MGRDNNDAARREEAQSRGEDCAAGCSLPCLALAAQSSLSLSQPPPATPLGLAHCSPHSAGTISVRQAPWSTLVLWHSSFDKGSRDLGGRLATRLDPSLNNNVEQRVEERKAFTRFWQAGATLFLLGAARRDAAARARASVAAAPLSAALASPPSRLAAQLRVCCPQLKLRILSPAACTDGWRQCVHWVTARFEAVPLSWFSSERVHARCVPRHSTMPRRQQEVRTTDHCTSSCPLAAFTKPTVPRPVIKPPVITTHTFINLTSVPRSAASLVCAVLTRARS